MELEEFSSTISSHNGNSKEKGLEERFDVSSKSDSNKSYKEKISEHFESVKGKTIRKHNFKKYKRKNHRANDNDILNKITSMNYENPFQESTQFFMKTIENVNETATTKEESIDSSSKKFEQTLISYFFPQQQGFHMTVSEKESFTVTHGFVNICKSENTEGKESLNEGIYVHKNRKIKRRHTNLLKQRLTSEEDNKWFSPYGNLELSENPLMEKSLRPDKDEGYEVEFKIADSKEICKEVVIIKEDILDIYLTELKFTHHPLYSVEHVLVEKLSTLYEQYLYVTKNNIIGKLNTQLEALRYLRKNIGNKKEIDDSALKRLRNIDKDIQKTRKNYFQEGKKERDNLKDILNTWKMIKKIREKQNFSNTNIKLLIKKETVDYENDRVKYNKIFSNTLQEVINETRADLQEKSDSEYKDEISDADSRSNSSEKTISEVDKRRIRKELQSEFQKSFRAPGEPILKLSLSKSHEITQIVENKKEITRRNAVICTKVYLNILCDNVTVCKSQPVCLNDNFVLEIKETFSIQLHELPNYLQIEVIEHSKDLVKKKLCEIKITVPAQDFSSIQNRPNKMLFEINEIVHYKHAGVGSGINFKAVLESVLENIDSTKLNDDDVSLYTGGYLEYYIGWQKTCLAKRDTFGQQIKLLKEITNKNSSVNVNKLSEWMNQTVPDPQNPGNAVFFEYMASCDAKLFRNNENFRLCPYAQSLKFCNVLAIEDNVRFKILQLRDKNEIKFDGVIVPNRLKEILFDAPRIMKKHMLGENDYSSQEDVEDDIEEQKNVGRKYLREVYTKLFQLCKNSENNLTYESVVDEKYLAHFEVLVKVILKNFLKWFHWQPTKLFSIKTNITREKKPVEYHKVIKQYDIMVKVISAKNVPSRTKSTFIKPSLSDTNDSTIDHSDNQVKPFLEITFENISVRTDSSSGVNPTWNETLMLPLEYQKIDYLNPESLKGTILVNLYDESDSPLKRQSKKRKNWLGGVEIPLSAICSSTTMSGLFKVRLPQLLLGYDTEVEKQTTKSPKITNTAYSYYTYVQMEISVVPNVPKLITNMESIPSGDLPYIQHHIIKWNEIYNSNFPNRKFSALAIDTSAKTACITRYLQPLEPPQINLEEFDVTAEQCLRYVSLIPFTDCNQFYHNVWLTTSELLRFMIGSIIDHAVALTCYLLALKMDVWLLLGFGIPHGSTAYVLTREYIKNTDAPAYYIYDVFYNEKYNLTDTHCPLQKIYCVVNVENVWANTQRSDNVHLTRFDLNRRSDWLSLFNSNIGAPVHFINNKVTYHKTINIDYLENEIEVYIKKKINKLRQLNRTIWNYSLTNDLKNVLRSFEINCMYNKNHYETINELNDKLSSYKVTGYVLNLSYLGTSNIIKNIKKLGICEDGSNSEFILSVYVHVYPGLVLSLWIFIGVITHE